MIAKLRIVAACTALLACGTESGEKIPLGQPSSAPSSAVAAAQPIPKSALDSANLAFRAKRYDDALVAYRRSAAQTPDLAAPWYGVYMVAKATQNAALADSAMAEVKKRTSEPGLLSEGTGRAHADTVSRRPHPTVTKAPTSGT
jgi:hypothetical protein